MSATESTMLELGVNAPDFSLPNTNPNYSAKTVSLGDYSAAEALLIMFVCKPLPLCYTFTPSTAYFGQ